MTHILLQNLAENLEDRLLPSSWTDFDLETFSPGKRLWEYQQVALRNALRALWRFYHGAPAPKSFDDPLGLKQDFMAWYQSGGLEANLDLPLDHSSVARRKLASLLENYYTSPDGESLPYEQFINL